MLSNTAQVPKAFLWFEEKQQQFPLSIFNTIGRHPSNTIQILDRLVSKRHARIYFHEKKFIIEDLDSRNGTFVNEEKIYRKVLNPNDIIRIGRSVLVFQVKDDEYHRDPPTDSVAIVSEDLDSALPQKVKKVKEVSNRFFPAEKIGNIESLRQDYEKLRIAFELSRKIGLELDFDRVLEIILEEALKIVPADRAVLLLLDGDKNLVPRAVKVRGENGHSGRINISRSILNYAIRNKRAVLTSDPAMDQRFAGAKSVILEGIRSAICVPLISPTNREKVFGAMHLDIQNSMIVFTEKDLDLITTVAAQAAYAIENFELTKKIEKEISIRNHLERYLSPAILSKLDQTSALRIDYEGEEVEATVMFTDIRGFTTISENTDPKELIKDLNEYFSLIVDIIFSYEGTLDKFIGDAVMAVWGTPHQDKDNPKKAVMAALNIQDELLKLNRSRIKRRKPPFLTGIGISTGKVIAGNMGSPKRMEFTVIGDTVNMASRLCAEAAGAEILISESTFKFVHPYFRFTVLPPVKLKGKSKMSTIFRVDGYIENENLSAADSFFYQLTGEREMISPPKRPK